MKINNDKWNYILKISQMSDRYGNLLIDFMDKYDLNNLYSATYEQAKEYYEKTIMNDYDE